MSVAKGLALLATQSEMRVERENPFLIVDTNGLPTLSPSLLSILQKYGDPVKHDGPLRFLTLDGIAHHMTLNPDLKTWKESNPHAKFFYTQPLPRDIKQTPFEISYEFSTDHRDLL